MNLNPFKKIFKSVEAEFKKKPPTIGVIGVSGVGKSTTLNSMFKTKLDTSPSIRCTTEFNAHLVSTKITSGSNEGMEVFLKIIDAPGLGEDVKKDPEYLEMYMEHLPKCDVILWVCSARNRAVALDQMSLKKLSKFHGKMIFGINQVDLVEPVNWDFENNMPSKEQEKNINEICIDRKKRFEDIVGKEIQIMPYGAKQYYRLTLLFEMMINACPKERTWLFQMVKGFTPKDWLDQVKGLTQEEKDKILGGE